MHLTPDEEIEYDALMSEAIGDDGSQATAEMAERVRSLLVDAEQAARPWAALMLDEDLIAGCRIRAKRWQDAHTKTLAVAYNGKVVAKPRRKGRRHRSPEDGSTSWQRTLFDDFTWVEVEEFLHGALGRVDAEQVNVETARRLMKLRDESPESVGPADAARRLGTTIDEVLAEAS